MAEYKIIDNEHRIGTVWKSYEEYKILKDEPIDNIIKFYRKTRPHLDEELSYLSYKINDTKSKNILSLGSGICIFEHMLKQHRPEINIYATDIIEEYIYHADKKYSDIHCDVFDMDKDDILEYIKKHKIDFIFTKSSLYALSYDSMLSFLYDIKKSDIKCMVIFFGGLKRRSKPATAFTIGKQYGYAYSNREMKKIFKKLKIDYHIKNIGSYKYVYILKGDTN